MAPKRKNRIPQGDLIATSVAAASTTVSPFAIAATAPIRAAAAGASAIESAPFAATPLATFALHPTHFLHHLPIAPHSAPHLVFGRVLATAGLRRARLCRLRSGSCRRLGRARLH